MRSMPRAARPGCTVWRRRGGSSRRCRRCSRPSVRAGGGSRWSVTAAATARSRATCSARTTSSCRSCPDEFRRRCARRCRRRRRRRTRSTSRARASRTRSASRGRRARCSSRATLDAVLFTAYFGGYSSLSDELRERELAVARELAAAARETGRPLVVHTMYWDAPPARALRAAGIAGVSRDRGGGRCGRGARRRRASVGARPAAAAGAGPADRRRVCGCARGARRGGRAVRARRARSRRRRGGAAAAELGYPVVLKALGALHKSDAWRTSCVGLADEAALRRCGRPARSRVRTRSRRARTQRRVSSCSSARAGTRASAPSSSSARAACTRSSSATPASRWRRSTRRCARCCCARSPARRCSPAHAAARRSTCAPRRKRSPRSRGSPRRTRSSRSSR